MLSLKQRGTKRREAVYHPEAWGCVGLGFGEPPHPPTPGLPGLAERKGSRPVVDRAPPAGLRTLWHVWEESRTLNLVTIGAELPGSIWREQGFRKGFSGWFLQGQLVWPWPELQAWELP